MKLQCRFAPTCGEFAPESMARFTGICSCLFLICHQKEKVLDIMAVFFDLYGDTWGKLPVKSARFLRDFGKKT